MSEALRHEVRPFGIRVSIVAPGDTKTRITDNRTITADATTHDFYPAFPRALKRTGTDEQNGPGPEGVARLVHRIVTTPNPRLRYTVGPLSERAAVWLKRFAPYVAVEYGMRWYYGLE